MQTKTIQKAIKLGFDLSKVGDETTIEALTKTLIEFFNENFLNLKSEKHFCEVTQSEHGQNVNFGNYSSSGQIVDWNFWSEKKQKVYHSNFVEFAEDGEPILIKLWCWSR